MLFSIPISFFNHFSFIYFFLTFSNTKRNFCQTSLIEKKFGRIRENINEARIIDLDLIDYSSEIHDSKDIILPHPRAHLRRFVMQPLYEIEKNWIHPILKTSVADILKQLDQQELELLSDFK